jgi:hypothetical protein
MPSRLKYINVKRYVKDSVRKSTYYALRYPQIPLSQDDIYVITTQGDRLDLLANQFYKDVDLWWIISIANPNKIRRDSFNLKSGIEIRIPMDIQSILDDFERLNK